MEFFATTGLLYGGNLHCWVVGFGLYSPGNKQKVDENLKQAKVKVYTPDQCNRMYIDANLQPNYPITTNNICTGPTQLLAVSMKIFMLLGYLDQFLCLYAFYDFMLA